MEYFTYFADGKMDALFKDQVSKETTFMAEVSAGAIKAGFDRKIDNSKFRIMQKYVEAEKRCSESGQKEYVKFTAPAKMNIIDETSTVYWFGHYYPQTSEKVKCVFYLRGSATNCVGYHAKAIDDATANSMRMVIDRTAGSNMMEKTISILRTCIHNDADLIERRYQFVAVVHKPVVHVTKDFYNSYEYQELIDTEADELRIITGSPLYVIPVDECCLLNMTNATLQVEEVNGKRRIITTREGESELFPDYIMTDYGDFWINQLKEKLIRPFRSVQFYDAIPEIERKIDRISSDARMSDDHKYEEIIKTVREYYYIPVE